MSPIDFLLISLCLTSATLTCIFWIAWRSFGRQTHALTWSLTFAVMTLQRALNLGRDWFPDWRVYWVVVDGLGILTVSLGLVGHRQRTGRRPLTRELLCAGSLVELAVIWFTFGEPHVGLGTGLQPLYGGLLVLWMAVILYRFRPRPLMAEIGAATVHGVFAILQLAAGSAALLQGAGGDPQYLELYRLINFLGMPAAFTGMGLFVVFILASDLAEKMKELAQTDPLTGLLNRRGFEEGAARVLAQAGRARQPLSVSLGDLDLFKSINDRWEHATGDRALQPFAEQLRRERRAEDLVARIGGEEFAILLPNAGSGQAVELAERVRRSLEDADFEIDGEAVQIRASFGVATLSQTLVDVTDLLEAADRALYRAKEAGRNAVRLAPPATGTPAAV